MLIVFDIQRYFETFYNITNIFNLVGFCFHCYTYYIIINTLLLKLFVILNIIFRVLSDTLMPALLTKGLTS